jgi:hypothetical protein
VVAVTYLEEVADDIEAEARHGEALDAGMRDLFLAYALLAFAKGDATTAADVHDAWVAWMIGQARSHRSIVPFEELALDVQREDDPFVEAIRRVARRRGLRGRWPDATPTSADSGPRHPHRTG